MTVYVLIAWLWTGVRPVAVTIDNIASARECERLGNAVVQRSALYLSGSTPHCYAVRKARP